MSTAYLMDGINMMFGIYSQQSSISSKLKQQLTYIEENRIGDITDAYYGAKALTNLANTAIGAVGTVIGVNLMAAGFTGEIAGAGATATGIGAAIGIPAMAVSAGLVATGAVAVGHGLSMSYTALNNFQNNAKKISSISQAGAGNIESLPSNAKDMFNKYDASGWKGSVPGQTPGTAAGSQYLNRDAKLPTVDRAGNPITYKEFDVNNKLPNAGRDGERFVRGSDGSVYYTNDHYGTFTKIK